MSSWFPALTAPKQLRTALQVIKIVHHHAEKTELDVLTTPQRSSQQADQQGLMTTATWIVT